MSGPTLHDLLGGLTLELSDRLEWMVLTWDLACIRGGSNDYYRLLMTDACLISAGGVRTPQVFATSAPQLGQRDALLFYSDDNLQESLRLTEARERDGYGLVCRPLAVDCSTFSGRRTSTGRTPRDAGSLLRELSNLSVLSLQVLAHINAARAAARDAYLAPGWQETTGHTDAARLWEGR